MEKNIEAYGYDTEIKLKPQWIKPEEFPFTGKITEVEAIEGKFKNIDFRLKLETEYDFRHFDAFGQNINWLVNNFGPTPRHWIGKEICIDLDGKKRKVRNV
jgi:hypothetical protein